MKVTTLKLVATVLLLGASSMGCAIAQEPELGSDAAIEQAPEGDTSILSETPGLEEIAEDVTDEMSDVPGVDELAEGGSAGEGGILSEDVMAEDPLSVEEAKTDEMPVAADEAMTDEPIAAEEALIDEVAAEAPLSEEPIAQDESGEIVADESGNIVEVAESTGEFEVFATALEAAGLTELLSSEGPFTIFAPTDDAFYSLPEGQLEALFEPENQEQLIALLTYHVVPGKVLSSDLEEGQVLTVEGNTVDISLDNGVSINEATVVAADMEASNGVIHAVDAVILPETIAMTVEE